MVDLSARAQYRQALKHSLLSVAEEQALGAVLKTGTAAEAAAARDKLITSHLRLAERATHVFSGLLPYEDLLGAAHVGLCTAADRFDHTRGRFAALAWVEIRGAIDLEMSSQGYRYRLSTHAHRIRERLRKAREQLSLDLGRDPTDVELTERSGVSQEWVDMLAMMDTPEVRLGDVRDGAETPGEGYDITDPAPLQDDILEEEERRDNLHRALELIPEREARVIGMIFGLGIEPPMTLQEVGKRIGVVRERVRQIRDNGFRRILQGPYGRVLELHHSEGEDLPTVDSAKTAQDAPGAHSAPAAAPGELPTVEFYLAQGMSPLQAERTASLARRAARGEV